MRKENKTKSYHNTNLDFQTLAFPKFFTALSGFFSGIFQLKDDGFQGVNEGGFQGVNKGSFQGRSLLERERERERGNEREGRKLRRP